MREHVALAGAALLATLAAVTPARADDAPKPIDVTAVSEKLAAYKDDVGNIYVLPAPGAFEHADEAQAWVFVGDGKTMYQQHVLHSNGLRKDGYEMTVWSPRAKDMPGAVFSLGPDGNYLACRLAKVSGGRHALVALTADELHTLIGKAKFMPPLVTRNSHFLARDDDATYYYVDSLDANEGGKGFRVFVGAKGAMKQLGLSNIASDTVGEIYATKNGRLKITAGRDAIAKAPGREASAAVATTAFWIKGGKKTELTVVPVFENRYLIFRELGIYSALGTACDDQ